MAVGKKNSPLECRNNADLNYQRGPTECQNDPRERLLSKPVSMFRKNELKTKNPVSVTHIAASSYLRVLKDFYLFQDIFTSSALNTLLCSVRYTLSSSYD